MELQVLIKYIEGRATKAEQESVDNWLNLDSSNQKYFEKIEKVWLSFDDLKDLKLIDVNKDWNLLEKRIEKKTPALFLKNAMLLTRPFRQFAAVFLLGIVIASLFFLVKNNKESFSGTKSASAGYELTVPLGQQSELVLPDGTNVKINSGSKLSIPANYSNTNRKVGLDGEAFFKVKKDASNPFIVNTSGINIKVTGTTFNVRAYPDEQLIETTLIEGTIFLSKSQSTTEDEVELTPNHKAILIKSNDISVSAGIMRDFKQALRVGEILVSDSIDTQEAISWTQGKIIFNNEYFDVIINRLEKYYGVKIQIEDESLKKQKYTGTLKKVSVKQTLRALQLTTAFTYIINDSVIILSKNDEPMKKK